jgi:hypothetical protein
MATLFLNNEQIGQVTSPSVIFANRNVDIHIGSTFGSINNLEGFIYRLDYWCHYIKDFSDVIGDCMTCEYCPAEVGCLSNCALNEYIDGGICT